MKLKLGDIYFLKLDESWELMLFCGELMLFCDEKYGEGTVSCVNDYGDEYRSHFKLGQRFHSDFLIKMEFKK